MKEYLKEINAVQTAAYLAEMTSVFPGGIVPREEAERLSIMDGLGEEVWDFFYEKSLDYYGCGEDVDALMVEYVLAHRQEFTEPSDEMVRKYKRQDRVRRHYGLRTSGMLGVLFFMGHRFVLRRPWK